MIRPFIVLGMPRSRTYWLSRFLSYREWRCGHEQIIHIRSEDDVASLLAQPCTGTSETAAAPWWRTIMTLAPETRVVVVKRPVSQVVSSFIATGLGFNVPELTRAMERMDAKLDQVAKRWPGALKVTFDDLNDEQVCAGVFEHCLPYQHDAGWWSYLSKINLQCDLVALFRNHAAHLPQLERIAAVAKQQTLTAMSLRRVVEPDGITFAVEPFSDFFRDSQSPIRAHLAVVGEHPGSSHLKNIELMQRLDDIGALQVVTARCNGRVFGYLMTILSPSLEASSDFVGTHATFYADPSFPGLGAKLQRHALAVLKDRGVTEVFMRAGTRGDGPRMGSLYKRLGAVPEGQLYGLKIQEA